MAEASGSTPVRKWLWQPVLIVFISNSCIMILELVAGRIIAPHVGSSLYTWTGVIGVILAGISLGNYVGGILADRWASPRLLGIIYIFASLACIAVLSIDRVYRITPPDWPIVAEVLALITAMFFIPSAILGTISPIVAKLAVSDLSKTGSTVGNIYAAGSLGSIVGTFATGFVLISWFGTYPIVLGVALLLLFMGLLFFLGVRVWSVGVAALVLIGATALVQKEGSLNSPCARETNYYCIKVQDEMREQGPVRLLVLDHLVHSYVELGRPESLVYDYEKMYAEVAAYRASTNPQLSALMIGGGGYTFPRYMQTVYPSSTVHVVEIDPGVTQVAYDLLGLDRNLKITTYNQDARMYFAGSPTMKYDLILGDAFNHFQVPYHLTTKEFDDRVHAWLAPNGLYVVNLIDGPYGEFVRAYVNTMQQTFRHVYLAVGSPDWRKTLRTTFVVVGTDESLDRATLARYDGGDGDPLLSRLLASDAEVQQLLEQGPRVTLTDQYAPVDQMLASVFNEQLPK